MKSKISKRQWDKLLMDLFPKDWDDDSKAAKKILENELKMRRIKKSL